MQLYMKATELIKLKAADSVRSVFSQGDAINRIKTSILNVGWMPDSHITICNNTITAGLLRVMALRQLLDEEAIKDIEIPVQVYRTMLVPVLVNVATGDYNGGRISTGN